MSARCHARFGWLSFAALLLGDLTLPPKAQAQTLPTGFVDELVASGLDRPTALAFAPDGRLFVTEQPGRVRVVTSGTLQPTPVLSLTVDDGGERGLLGLAFHPNFASNRYVYLYHTVLGTPAHNRVTRFTANGNQAEPASARLIVQLDDLRNARNHNGGALHFGRDGKLYVAVGDNALSSNAQSLANRLGKILRLEDDGAVPSDNPTTFPGISGSPAGDNRAIWAVGLRNPYTFAIQPHSGSMMINEVGSNTYEEVNRGQRGANYGWPMSEGPTDLPGITAPIHAYAHASTPGVCAVAGGTFYNPKQENFPSQYVGKYFFADYCGGWINYLDPAQPAAVTRFLSGADGLVGMTVGSDGALYYLRHGDGQLRRISYTGEVNQQIVVGTSQLEVVEGTNATVGVRLAQPPAGNVTLTVTRTLSDRDIRLSPSTLTFTPADWNTTKNLTISVAQDFDQRDEGARFTLLASGLAAVPIWVTGVDNDRTADQPRAVITRPRSGDTISGTSAEFFGDGLDDIKVVRAQFLINDVVRYTDTNSSAHFHIGGDHNLWNTATLADGVHVLELRVFDNTGNMGRHTIKVRIDN